MRSILIPLYRIYVSFTGFIVIHPFKWVYEFGRFVKEYSSFKSEQNNPNFRVKVEYWYPCLTDRTSTTPLDPVYFYQDSWAMGKIFGYKPVSHIDIGSAAKTIGILSQFVPVTMVDIRPIELTLPGLTFKQGTILDLPFEDASQESVSSLCVIEHIGLGRYGDPIDPWGSEKSIAELQRITRADGVILFSVPIDSENTVYFNAHRAFTRSYILQLFDQCNLIDEQYIYGTGMQPLYDTTKGFGIGLYMFKKK